MRSIKAEALTVEKFLPFGFYARVINPEAERLGAVPVEFFRDMVQQDLGTATTPSFSTCRVEPRDLVIDVSEYHDTTGEAMLPLDNDVLIHVGPATPHTGAVPLDKLRVFHVPVGTLVVIRPGVWHNAPFTLNDKPANVLIVLPERIYANDCTAVAIAKADQIAIECPRCGSGQASSTACSRSRK
jgi:ureidoglycolate lyase